MGAPLCPIVGIGASAGGLDALKALFQSLPADTGAAFVVIQHLDPKHESLTAEILTRFTSMPTAQVTAGMLVEQNHVYVIPPNAYLTLSGHTLELGKPVLRHGLRMPVDTFLSSLAEQHQERAVAIIVSGTGSDGTLGLRAIKAGGGLVLAQSPDTAQYDGMPRSAIATGLVDIVCPVEEMHKHIIGYLRHAYVIQHTSSIDSTPVPAADAWCLRQILAVLETRIGHDFRVYKQGTLGRRIARRMGLNHIDTLADYLTFLRAHDDEARKLFKDLLISVTSFFRDSEAFDVLDQKVIAPLVAKKQADEPIRVWVPGCATGEEAYSIAMLLLEHLDKAPKHCPIQVFASDIDESALSGARTGLYPENVAANLSPERLQRFFTKEDHSYRVNKSLRDTVTFAMQDMISDPPFSKIDLICCRNLLIYLNPDAQRKVLGLFHFALRDDGHLFLGHSETVNREEMFEPLSKKWRIYRRTGVAPPPAVDVPLGSRSSQFITPVRARTPGKANLNDIAQQHLLQEFAPAAVVIDGKHRVLHFSGATARYLEQPAGAPTQDLLTLARHELRAKLRVALRRAVKEGQRIDLDDAHVLRDGARIPVKITLKPLAVPGSSDPVFLVTFEDRLPSKRQAKTKTLPKVAADSSLLQQMEDELKITREDLQSNIEELESANEELQAANEEVMSVNEELQSMNEELTTVNSQLKDNVEELAKANDDLANLFSSTDIATLFVDTQLKIGRFTPSMTRLMNLITSDIGRPLGDIRPTIMDPTLLDDARQVLDKLTPVECELATEAGACYLRRVLPYRTSDNRIAGAVITYIDISERKRAETKSQRLAAVVRDSNDAVTVQDLDGKIIAWNRGAERMYGWSEREALAMNISSLVPEAQRETAMAVIQRIARGEAVHSLEIKRLRKDGRELDVWLTATPIVDQAQRITAVATTERDITERKRASDTLRASEAKFRALIESAPEALVIVNEAGKIEVANAQAQRLFGYPKDELLGMSVEQLIPERFRAQHVTDRHGFLGGPKIREMGSGIELFARTQAGDEIPIEVSLSPIATEHEQVVCAAIRDITERKRSEAALRAAKALAESALAIKARFLATASHDLRQPLQSLNLLNAALLKTTDEPKARQMLTMQSESLGSMSRLLDSLLDITKLESGTVVVLRKDIAVQSLFQSLRATFDGRAQEKGLDLKFEATAATVRSDPDLLAQLLQNLIANAIRYTKQGSVQIGCTRDGDRARIAVTDTGIGIPPDQLNQIFDEFHQVGRNPQERHAGLGLGLAIVRRVARLLETRVDVTSEMGRGSTFSILLPLCESKVAEPVQHETATDSPGRVGGHILLIDDDPAVLAATHLLLSLEPGFIVTTATSPADAYAVLTTLTPDLIITDFHLNQKESGVDIIRNARERSGRIIPAILATGDTGPSVRTLGIGDLHRVSKPVDATILITLVQRLLASKPPSEAEPTPPGCGR
ncbi:MAG: CheR family methyltransferase [Steroidobacteraceae bacterium]